MTQQGGGTPRIRVPIPTRAVIDRVRLPLHGLYQIEEELLSLGGSVKISGEKFSDVSSVDDLVSLGFARTPVFTISSQAEQMSREMAVRFGEVDASVRIVWPSGGDDPTTRAVYSRIIDILLAYRQRVWWWVALVLAALAIDALAVAFIEMAKPGLVSIGALGVFAALAIIAGLLFMLADRPRVELHGNRGWIRTNLSQLIVSAVGGVAGTFALFLMTKAGLFH